MGRFWLLLVFAAALGLWLWQASPRQETSDTTAAAAHPDAEPGYAAINADLLDTGVDGQPRFRLRATRIEQAAPKADIALSDPKFQHQGKSTWTLTAHSGLMPPDIQRLQLAGDVRALGTLGAAPITIRTETLAVDLQQQKLDTPAHVAIQWGRNRLSATGLHADMKTERLRLESDIHGEYTH